MNIEIRPVHVCRGFQGYPHIALPSMQSGDYSNALLLSLLNVYASLSLVCLTRRTHRYQGILKIVHSQLKCVGDRSVVSIQVVANMPPVQVHWRGERSPYLWTKRKLTSECCCQRRCLPELQVSKDSEKQSLWDGFWWH